MTAPPRHRARALLAALAVATLLGRPPVARAQVGVLLPGTQPADGSGDPAFPPFVDGSNPGSLDGPGVCDNCHAGYRAPGQAIYEPWDSWAGSLMANAARDPLFWAALDVANQDDAARLGDVGVGDFCLRCHAPWAWYEGRSHCDTPWGEHFDGSCLTGPPSVPDNDGEGIICHFCHRMYDASTPPAGEFADPLAPRDGNGQVYLWSDRNSMRGPYSDAEPRSHRFEQSLLHRASAFCGQCHDVTNPALNRRDPTTGADLGRPMPVERTYAEWRQSAFADPAAPEHATCQQCHMPQPDLDGDGTPDAGYACTQQPGLRGDGTALEGPLRTHFFAGGGTWMIDVLRSEVGTSLGRLAQYDAARTASQRVLATAVDLTLSGPPSAPPGGVIDAVATLTNRTGHKFPTGYPEGRRAFLHVRAGEDADGDGALSPGEVTFESNAHDAATGTLVRDAQSKVYELHVGVWDWNGTDECDIVDASGTPMFHFVLNDCIALDNRIPPAGFVPDADTAPVSHAYPPDPARPGALAHWDDTPYAVPVPPGAVEPFIIEVTAYYQTTSREYVDFLQAENASTCDPADVGCDPTLPDARPNRGEKVHALWEGTGRSAPVALATTRIVVPLVAPRTGACCVGADCFDLAAADCDAQGGAYRGDAVPCESDTCAPPPTGACCLGTDCLDLAAPDCDAQGGTYRGDAVPCATDTCAPPAVPGEAGHVDAGAAPLLVAGRDRVTGTLSITWGPACDATDHAVAWGPLAGVGGHAWIGLECVPGAGGSTALVLPAGSQFFVVVGQTATAEGSCGRDSFGLERPEPVLPSTCDRPQDLGATCD